MARPPVIQLGERYGRLTVAEPVASPGGGQRRYRCLCDCGNCRWATRSEQALNRRSKGTT